MIGPHSIIMLGVFSLLGWRAYRRFRRLVGRQRFSKARLAITLIIYPVLILLVGFVARSHPEKLWSLIGGLVAGAMLGVFGLKKTRFESTEEGLFYTPNAHLGIGLSLLFFLRIGYRSIEVYAFDSKSSHGQDVFVSSGLTMAVFGLLAGYYISYAIGLVNWRRGVLKKVDG